MISYTQYPHLIVVEFSQNVSASLTSSDLRVEKVTGPDDADAIATLLDYDSGTNTARFKIDSATAPHTLPESNYRATIFADDVTNAFGEPLADDVIVDFFVLPGDANRDRWVDVADLGTVASNWQTSPRTFSEGDFDYTQMVDVNDLGILASN